VCPPADKDAVSVADLWLRRVASYKRGSSDQSSTPPAIPIAVAPIRSAPPVLLLPRAVVAATAEVKASAKTTGRGKSKGKKATSAECRAEQERVARLIESFALNTILIWVDGSCPNNTGSSPCGSGCTISAPMGIDGATRDRLRRLAAGATEDVGFYEELHTFRGVDGTNNIGELGAVFDAVTFVRDRIAEAKAAEAKAAPDESLDALLNAAPVADWSGPVEILSDSTYAAGVCTHMRAHKNQHRVRLTRAVIDGLAARGTTVRFHHVRAHRGVPGNERVDELADLAATSQTSSSPNPAPFPAEPQTQSLAR
jgi:ribonuclease HI